MTRVRKGHVAIAEALPLFGLDREPSAAPSPLEVRALHDQRSIEVGRLELAMFANFAAA